MIALLQRVTQASVEVDNKSIAAINEGLLVLLGVEKGDSEIEAEKLVKRIINYRVFSDNAGKMNLSVKDIKGEVLLVPQFTLPADTQKGSRPSFTPAASPQDGKYLFEHSVSYMQQIHGSVATGQFGADMQVSLVNNGPVTFWLQVNPTKK
jgi:D-tyrosyl-tRNA(Tyr) deacylase